MAEAMANEAAGRTGRWKAAGTVLLVLVVVGAVWLLLGRRCLAWFDFTIDDAFITARYADNLARGFGPVYNPGWPAVEGASNLLFVFLLAFLRFLEVGFPLGAKIIGVVSTALLLGLTAWSARRATRSSILTAMAVVLLSMNSALALWTVGGLETTLYALLVTAAWSVFFFADDRDGRRSACAAGVIAALAVMTRVDALLLFPCLLAVSAGSVPRRARAGRFLLSAAALLVPFFAWKWSFYGSWLPNPVSAKSNFDIAWSRPWQTVQAALAAPHQVELMRRFLAVNLGLVILGVLAIALPREKAPARAPDRAGTTGSVAVFGALFIGLNLLAYLKVWVWMPGHRYYVPLLPLLCVMAALGAKRWLDLGAKPRIHAVLAVLLAAALYFHYHRPQAREVRHLTKYAERYAVWQDQEYTPVGEWIARNTGPDALLAIRDAGRIPFLCRRPTLDLGGLNDESIARLMQRDDPEALFQHVLNRRPEILVLSNTLDPDRAMSRDPRVRQAYRLLFKSGSSSSSVGQYNLLVFRRRDLPDLSGYASVPPGDVRGGP